MIAVERINELTSEVLATCDSAALEEIERGNRYKFDVIKNSTAVWLIRVEGRPVFFFGITRGTMLGWGAEMWFMGCKDTSKLLRKVIPFTRRGIRRLTRLYGVVKSTVDADFTRGQRFVEFFGFRRVSTITAVDNKTYFVYEKRSPWLQQQ